MSWFVILAVLGSLTAAVLFVRSRRGSHKPDVGSVSGQWIAEHQADRS